MPSRNNRLLLAIIVFAQFAGTSLWFAGNAIIDDIAGSAEVSDITTIVQLGFIGGTLVFSVLTIADRFKAKHVFFFSALLASLANLLLLWFSHDEAWLYTLRFITGFFLAGIYPVGMKIAADCFPGKLGNALGFLVGALVLGTAFPHLVKSDASWFNWKDVIRSTSILAIAGGLLILFTIPPGFIKKGETIELDAAFRIFNSDNFRSAAFGYFGHMWELYAFWAFTPLIIQLYNHMNNQQLNAALWSFVIIASGSLGCIAGGIVSRYKGSKKVAFTALLISGICCLLSPLFFSLTPALFLLMMITWGISVVADSPQFSTLVAQAAPADLKGTALTIVTSFGFAITIISILLLKPLTAELQQYAYLILFPGPVLGLWNLYKMRYNKNEDGNTKNKEGQQYQN